jgi:hypothetical protein
MSMTQSQLNQPLFALGRLVATPGRFGASNTLRTDTPLSF